MNQFSEHDEILHAPDSSNHNEQIMLLFANDDFTMMSQKSRKVWYPHGESELTP